MKEKERKRERKKRKEKERKNEKKIKNKERKEREKKGKKYINFLLRMSAGKVAYGLPEFTARTRSMNMWVDQPRHLKIICFKYVFKNVHVRNTQRFVEGNCEGYKAKYNIITTNEVDTSTIFKGSCRPDCYAHHIKSCCGNND